MNKREARKEALRVAASLILNNILNNMESSIDRVAGELSTADRERVATELEEIAFEMNVRIGRMNITDRAKERKE